MSTSLKSYELTYIMGEQAKPEEAKTKLTELKKLIAEMGGKVTREELWGRRELAYIIDKSRSGFYTTIWFELPTEQLKPLNQHLNFDDKIIRSLTTVAFEYSQPGSLYPVVEEAPTPAPSKDEKASAEAMLRMSNTKSKKNEVTEVEVDSSDEDLPEDERLKKLDEKLDELLSDDQE